MLRFSAIASANLATVTVPIVILSTARREAENGIGREVVPSVLAKIQIGLA